jgi:hypothetical protein
VNAGSTAARWRSVFIALLLALAIGSAGQISPAQAAPDNPADIYFDVWAAPEAPPPVCINKTLKIYVAVHKGIVKTIGGKEHDLSSGFVSGVTIHSSMSTSNVGTLTPESLPVEVDSGASSPGQVMFVFTATHRGTTTLIFESNGVIGAGADVPGAPPDSMLTSLGQKVPAKKAEIPVTVSGPCKFKVTTITRVSAATSNAEGTGDEAEVVADAQGNFKGSTTVNWEIVNTSSCVYSLLSLTPSQVDWSGTIDSDQLVLTGTFQPTTTSFSFTCPGIPVGDSGQHTNPIEPLTIRVALTGGGSTQAQMVSNAAGSAVIVVIPEECNGTASC